MEDQMMGSTTRARALRLLGQLQGLRQGNSSVSKYLGRAQVLVEELSLAGRPGSLEEHNLYVFRGLPPELRSMASSLTTQGSPVTLKEELSDHLAAREFIYTEDFLAAGPNLEYATPMFV